MPRRAALLAAALLAATPARGDMYDVVQPRQVPPPGGCKPWADAGKDAWWVNKSVLAGAGASCAQPGLGQGGKVHVDGSYCIGAASGDVEYCTSADGVPEQINVQIASQDSVVLAWVTFEQADPAAAPTAELDGSGTLTGVTHKHTTQGGRVYYMHFVRVTGLAPKSRHSYRVRSGGDGSVWSDTYSFRAPYSGGETRIALYGDMGVYKYNNMANLHGDAVEREAVDLIIHNGDHCYNEGDDDEKRADGYMQAFQQTIANVPWMPTVGNHEYYAGAKLGRYLDSTWQKWDPLPSGAEWGEAGLKGYTTATSAMGAFLSTGNHHAAGVAAKVPSHTSRYFSVDFGQVHLVALSLNGYNGVDDCTTECNEQQKAWLDQDLASVDRSRTPWIIAFSHFPMYVDSLPTPDDHIPLKDQAWNAAEECEYKGHQRGCAPEGWRPKPGVGYTRASMQKDLEPLFYKYGVDLYWGGHVHYYQTFHGPLKGGIFLPGQGGDGLGYQIEKCMGNEQGTKCTNPKGVIHATSGNAGPPSPTTCAAGLSSRNCNTAYSYTRLTVKNATHLLWEQVGNADGAVFDTWWLEQNSHGPFP